MRRSSIFAASAITALAPTLCAQQARPSATRRIVRQWQFEDVAQHGQPIPEHWNRGQAIPETRSPDGRRSEGHARHGFPPWNRAAYDGSRAHSGDFSIALPTKGGSASLILDHRSLPILPDADHRVSCALSTRALAHARARMLVTLFDANGRQIDQPFITPAITSEGAWTPLEVHIPGSPDAASMSIELQLAQPDVLAGSTDPLDPAGVAWPADLDACAWFDDVTLHQEPRISLTTTHPGEIIASASPPSVELRVRDTAGESLRARLAVYDARGDLIDEHSSEVDPSWTPARWTPDLPRKGWYALRAEIDSPAGPVGTRASSFVWTSPAHIPAGVRAPIGIRLHDLDPLWTGDAAHIVHATGASSVSVPIYWGLASRIEPMNHLIDHLLDGGLDVTLVLDGVPSTDPPRQAARAMILDPSLDPSRIPILPLLSRYGERVACWQLGDPDDAPRTAGDGEALSEAGLALLRRFVPSPRAAVPWDMQVAPPTWATSERTIAPHLPEWPGWRAIDGFVAAWTGRTGDDAPPIALDSLDADRWGADWCAEELARRIVSAWAAGADPISVPQPWTINPGLAGGALAPTPEFPAVRTLAHTLAGVRYVGRFPTAPGVHAVFGRGGPTGGILIAWSDTPGSSIEAHLGDGTLHAFDIDGNDITIRRARRGVRIPVGTAPIIITGIDPELAAFREGLAITPKQFGVSAARQEAELIVTNPWPRPASVRIRFAGPESWDVVPRIVTTTIPIGETARIPITVLIGLGELAGRRDIELEATITSDSVYAPFDIALPADLGMAGIHAMPMYDLLPDGRLAVEVVVTNTSTQVMALGVLAHAPGRATQESVIAAISPGQSVMRRFLFPGAADMIGGEARISIRKNDSTERLNLAMPIR